MASFLAVASPFLHKGGSENLPLELHFSGVIRMSFRSLGYTIAFIHPMANLSPLLLNLVWPNCFTPEIYSLGSEKELRKNLTFEKIFPII